MPPQNSNEKPPAPLHKYHSFPWEPPADPAFRTHQRLADARAKALSSPEPPTRRNSLPVGVAPPSKPSDYLKSILESDQKALFKRPHDDTKTERSIGQVPLSWRQRAVYGQSHAAGAALGASFP
ncbi:hypothetical protein JCM10908_006864 [Rhodotorula pacifica]|uniref:uncharacterized protein n=1 Tax=Rhodotorula pacifica TaxID=1495444 RepID=UPI00316C3B08